MKFYTTSNLLPIAPLLLLALLFVFGSEEESSAPEHGKINTADATPVDPGVIEVEWIVQLGSSRTEFDRRRRAQRTGIKREHTFETSITCGVVKDVDVNFTLGVADVHDRVSEGPTRGIGLTDAAAGVRWQFWSNDDLNLELAYLSGLTAPTGTRSSGDELGTSQEFWSIDQALVLSKDWVRWTANIELGFSLPAGHRREDERGTSTANAAVGFQALDWLQPEFEVNFSHNDVWRGRDSFALGLTAGLVMPINERLRLNLGVQQIVTGRNTDETTSVVLAVKVAW